MEITFGGKMKRERKCRQCGISEKEVHLSNSSLCRDCGNKRMIAAADAVREVKVAIEKEKHEVTQS